MAEKTPPGARKSEDAPCEWVRRWINYFFECQGIERSNYGSYERPYHVHFRRIATDLQVEVHSVIIELEFFLNYMEQAFFAEAVRARKNNNEQRSVRFIALTRNAFSLRQNHEGAMTLISHGFDTVARQNLRSQHEIALSLCRSSFDAEYARHYLNVASPEDANRFWHEWISRDKLKKAIADYSVKQDLICLLTKRDFAGENIKVLGVSVHPNGLANHFSFKNNWEKLVDEFEDKPTNLSVLSAAFQLVGSMKFVLEVIQSDLQDSSDNDVYRVLFNPVLFDKDACSRYGEILGGFALLLAGLSNQQPEQILDK
ncbi:hypothetical protein [Jannaschia rubra]|uniref:hypothetical protein n=1 Tax=Jannaschia rubra TaxID=282197 RepID=UPI00249002C2|nr:hypothetical protein [Jannaschia rubra]